MTDIAQPNSKKLSILPVSLLACVVLAIAWSWIGAASRGTWWLEAFPVLIAIPILLYTARSFPLTRLAYVLIAIHCVILLVGAHYTYEHVPLFDWVRERFNLRRNDYDRLGHVAQGFVPAIVAREILLRRRVVLSRGWIFFLVLCVCMAISACYELLEWMTAEILGSGADQFLATQGDPFDTQWDMFSALIGATISLLILSRFHDRELRKLASANSGGDASAV